MEEFLTLNFKKGSGFLVQKKVEEYIPHFIHGVGRRSVVCNHREEEYVPCYATSAFPQVSVQRVDGGRTQDGRLDVAAGEIECAATFKE